MSDAAEYRDLFVSEAQENLRALSDGALRLERPDGASAVDGLFRAAHTVKGMSATMGFEGLTRLCHALEDALDGVRSGARGADSGLADALLQAVDAMQAMLADIAAGGDGGLPQEALLERLRTRDSAPEADAPEGGAPAEGSGAAVRAALAAGVPVLRLDVELEPSCSFKGVRALLVRRALERLAEVLDTRPSGGALESGDFEGPFSVWTSGGPDAAAQEEAVRGVLEVARVRAEALGPERAGGSPGGERPSFTLEPLAEALVGPPRPRVLDQEAGRADGPARPEPGQAQTLRVSAERLDKILDLVGELVTARIRLTQLARDSGGKELSGALLSLEHVVNELQQEVTAARLVPVDQSFSRFPRLIRDLSREMGKPMELLIEGRGIELDRGVLGELDEALLHLLRNAADHGIEDPARRAGAGKPAVGTIRLEARRERNHVVVTVEDDGAGIDMERVRQVAVEKGLLDDASARSADDEEVLSLIFSPGFSTAGRVTRVSGRGVGMDAARARIEALGGSLKAENFPGKGARFRVRVPLTLAIIRALRVRSGREQYLAPVANVVEAFECARADFGVHGGAPSVDLRGEPLPLLRLEELLSTPGGGDSPLCVVLVVEGNDARFGLAVDEVLGQDEVAIKGLGRAWKSVRGFGGVTVLGDGSVRLILDLPSLPGLEGAAWTN